MQPFFFLQLYFIYSNIQSYHTNSTFCKCFITKGIILFHFQLTQFKGFLDVRYTQASHIRIICCLNLLPDPPDILQCFSFPATLCFCPAAETATHWITGNCLLGLGRTKSGSNYNISKQTTWHKWHWEQIVFNTLLLYSILTLGQ
jgi:hypothetical protein